MRFFYCSICGNQIEMIKDSGNIPSCCGRQMVELRPESTDGALEKHVPKFEILHENCLDKEKRIVKVQVGEIQHPMDDAHFIWWVIFETDQGVYRKDFYPHEKPVACFHLAKDERPKAIYSYCNLHGLWVKKM